MFQKIKAFIKEIATEEIKYYRPTLRVTFLDGDVKEVTPYLWHRGTRNNWQLYYVEDGILLNRFPLAAVKEVEITECECRSIISYDSGWTPLYATDEDLDKKVFRKKRFGG